jgi:hypothetical protein
MFFYKHIVKIFLNSLEIDLHLSLHVLIKSRSHNNNQNFFQFVIVVSNWSHGSILSSAKTCSSFLTLIRATISPCFQFCYHGIFYYTSCLLNMICIFLPFVFLLWRCFNVDLYIYNETTINEWHWGLFCNFLIDILCLEK